MTNDFVYVYTCLVFGYGPVASWSSILAIYGPVFKDSSREMPDASESLKTLLDDID